MKTTEENFLQEFYSYFNALDVDRKVEIRDRFLSESKLSLPSWYYKIRYRAFSLLERKAIETICEMEFKW